MSARWALRGLRWSYCAFIAWASAQTFFHAGHDPHALVLSVVELAAIAAFLFKRTETIACYILLIVFGLAALLTAMDGEVPLRFAYYAMTAIGILTQDQAPQSA